MPTIIATSAAVDSNSYETLAEANTYFDERLPLTPPWVTSGDASIRALIMATRVLDMMAVPRVRFVSDGAYYVTSRQWTGAPTTTTQRLAWPRTGMYNRNGVAIPSGEVPFELKDAESEMAGQLLMGDTTLDNAISVQGISSIKAGSVSLAIVEYPRLDSKSWVFVRLSQSRVTRFASGRE